MQLQKYSVSAPGQAEREGELSQVERSRIEGREGERERCPSRSTSISSGGPDRQTEECSSFCCTTPLLRFTPLLWLLSPTNVD